MSRDHACHKIYIKSFMFITTICFLFRLSCESQQQIIAFACVIYVDIFSIAFYTFLVTIKFTMSNKREFFVFAMVTRDYVATTFINVKIFTHLIIYIVSNKILARD